MEEESVYLEEEDSECANSRTRHTNLTTTNITSPEDQIKHQFAKAIDNLKEKPVFNSRNELTCRDQQKLKVELFLKHCLSIMGKTSLPSLYICGVPGIGKTLTMLTVSDWFTKQNYGHVKCIYINGMEMRRVSKVYSVILKKLVKRKSKKPYHYLDLLLTQNPEYPHQEDVALIENKLKIVIIDQIDYFLEEKYQQTLFQFFEWTNNIKTKMVLIGLSNTINFVQKLNHKINSRMQLSVNLLFQSYSPQQVQIILKSRLGQYTRLFSETSLTFISTIIGRFSSDIRSALHLCEKALLIALEQSVVEGKEVKVLQSHVEQCIQPDPAHEILKGLPSIHKILLLILIDIKISQSEDESQLITSKFNHLCEKNQIPVYNPFHLIRQLLSDLHDIRAIEMKGPRRWDRSAQHVYFERMAISVYPNILEYIEKSSEYLLLK